MADKISCFACHSITSNTMVHLGPKSMATKDLEEEMASGSEFGRKLREIAEKVEEL